MTSTTYKGTGFNPGTGTGSYLYDANGNMWTDPYKGLTITYNHLNLPKTFNFGGGKVIDITYDATGNKLRKTIIGSANNYTQEYISGIEYRGTALEAIYTAEGRVFNNAGTNRYEYTIKDHLGNARISFTDKDNDGLVEIFNTTANEVLQENHYYPFGLNYDGPWMNDAARDNRYQYNGKEINDDFGLNWYNYGFRWYDAAVARFHSVDPVISDFPYLTPYNYAGNKPVNGIDLYGLQWAPPRKMDGTVDADAATKIYTDPANMIAVKMAMEEIPFVGELMLISEGDYTGAAMNLIPGAGILRHADEIRDIVKASDDVVPNSSNPLKIEIADENKIDRNLLDAPTKPGNAPTFKKDGTSVEIHHDGQKREGPFKEMHKEDHRGKDNDKVNHPNKGQKSEIDRKEFDKARREYWKNDPISPWGKKD